MNDADIYELIERRLESFWTAAPATVTKVNGNFVSVTLSTKMKMTNGFVLSVPEIENVPLMKLGCASFSITLPIKIGDPVIVIFFSSDSSKWENKKDGEASEPISARRNELEYSVAIPLSRGLSDPSGSIVVSNDGTVKINNHLEIKP